MDTKLQVRGYKKLNDWTWEKRSDKFRVKVTLSGFHFGANQYWISSTIISTKAMEQQLVGVYPVAETSLLAYLDVVEDESRKETA